MCSSDLDPAATATMGAGLTVNVTGKVSGGDVSDTGTITILGNTASTSVGAAITVTMIPVASGGTLTWSCVGTPSKYMPASCR